MISRRTMFGFLFSSVCVGKADADDPLLNSSEHTNFIRDLRGIPVSRNDLHLHHHIANPEILELVMSKEREKIKNAKGNNRRGKF